jgi:hypothetical protein
MKHVVVLLALILLGGPAFAQSPYAGAQTRAIKALSEAQIADLRAGRGMGFALAAELNGYPGPIHVLELGDKLALSAGQRAKFQGMFASMKAEAIPLGEQLIALERALDRQFADRTVTAESLGATTAQIGALQGQLRSTHLKYHLAAVDILTPDQSEKYASLRGYRSPHPDHGHHQ